MTTTSTRPARHRARHAVPPSTRISDYVPPQRVDTDTIARIVGPTLAEGIKGWGSGDDEGMRSTHPRQGTVTDAPTDLYAALARLDDEDLALLDESEPGIHAYEEDPDPTPTGELFLAGSTILFRAGQATLRRTEIPMQDALGQVYVRRYADRSNDTSDMYWADGVTIRHRSKEPWIMAFIALAGTPGRAFRDRIVQPVKGLLTRRPSFAELQHQLYIQYRAARLGIHLARHADGRVKTEAKRAGLLKASRILFSLTAVYAAVSLAVITALMVSGGNTFLGVYVGVLGTLMLAVGGVGCDLLAEGANSRWARERMSAFTPDPDSTEDIWSATPPASLPVLVRASRPRTLAIAGSGGGRHRAPEEQPDLAGAPWH